MKSQSQQIAFLFLLCLGCAHAETLQLKSPDGAVQVEFTDADSGPTYNLRFQGRPILGPSALGYVLAQGGSLQAGLRIRASQSREVDQQYDLPVGKTSTVHERFNELSIDLAEAGEGARALRVILRAYDDGLAFRYVLPVQPALKAVDIQSELTQFAFTDNHRCWGLNLGRYNTSHEGEFDPIQAGQIRDFHRFDSPLVCTTGGGMKLVATNSDGAESVGSLTLDCSLCSTAHAPPPATQPLALLPQPLAYRLKPQVAARIAALPAPPLPARGPPHSL